jgi:hypothetical protein
MFTPMAGYNVKVTVKRKELMAVPLDAVLQAAEHHG